jgi:hypothetical protein
MVIFGDNNVELSGSSTIHITNSLFRQSVTEATFCMLDFKRIGHLIYIHCCVLIRMDTAFKVKIPSFQIKSRKENVELPNGCRNGIILSRTIICLKTDNPNKAITQRA